MFGELNFSSLDGGDVGAHNGGGFLEISKIFVIYRMHFSLERYHLTEYISNSVENHDLT